MDRVEIDEGHLEDNKKCKTSSDEEVATKKPSMKSEVRRDSLDKREGSDCEAEMENHTENDPNVSDEKEDMDCIVKNRDEINQEDEGKDIGCDRVKKSKKGNVLSKKKSKLSQQNSTVSIKLDKSDFSSGSEEENDNQDSSIESSEEDGHKEEMKDKRPRKTSRESAQDSDSSSLPSLEEQDEGESKPQPVKKKRVKKSGDRESSTKEPKEGKEENKTVTRLKRYVALCGVRKNYKKLFEGCKSAKSKISVLKRELEELGVQGQPSIQKCKKARLMREQAQELADLDVSNIITTQGRPKRNVMSALQQLPCTTPALYKRSVNSSSESEDNSHKDRLQKRATDWGNLHGIISDDGDSD